MIPKALMKKASLRQKRDNAVYLANSNTGTSDISNNNMSNNNIMNNAMNSSGTGSLTTLTTGYTDCSHSGSEDNYEGDATIAYFYRRELKVGKILGKGSFSNVYEVNKIQLQHNYTTEKKQRKWSGGIKTRMSTKTASEVTLTSSAIARRSKRDACKAGTKYALKQLKRSLQQQDEGTFLQAADDLANEGNILSSLDHENIIRIHGLSMGATATLGVSLRHDSYFLLLDQLQGTLEDKIEYWQRVQKKSSRNAMVDTSAFNIRLKTQMALQIANALEYLHERRIIFRDLKPQNIGLITDDKSHSPKSSKSVASSTTIKLFDFGLSRHLPSPARDNNDSKEEYYHMSLVGTRRFMAPEIFNTRGRAYNTKADVYSWSMVFCYMLTLVQPYNNFESMQHEQFVCKMGIRPNLGESGVPISLLNILLHGWDQSVEDRLSISAICTKLKEFLSATTTSCESKLSQQ